MANIDAQVWLLELGGTLAGFGLAAAAIWNLSRVCSRPRGRLAIIWGGAQVLAALTMLYVMLAFHLISFGTKF